MTNILQFLPPVSQLVREALREEREKERIESELDALDDGLTLNQLSPETIEYLAEKEGWYEDDGEF